MDTVKTGIKWFLMVGGMIFWFFVTVGLMTTEREQRVDCSVAEFHPDYPAEVKEQCRRMRKHVIDT